MTILAIPLRAALGVLLMSLLLAGCGHTPTPHYYVLSGPETSAATGARGGPRIGLGPITLPDYLDRPQVVTRASATRLELSNRHRWAEPLTASFSRALLADYMQERPYADIVVHPWPGSLSIAQQVRIEVMRFDRGTDGAFRLSARWSVSGPGDKDRARTQVSDIDIPLSAKADDYDALVVAANGAVAALAKTIATQLQSP